MTVGFVQVQPTSDVTEFSSTSCSYERRVVLTIEIMEMMNGIIQFRCRTATESGNLISDTVYVNVAPQGIYEPRCEKTGLRGF